MLVVPHGFDQFDNAARLQRLGVARVLHARHYTTDTALPLLSDLLDNAHYSQCAERCAQAVQSERGSIVAADLIEDQLRFRS